MRPSSPNRDPLGFRCPVRLREAFFSLSRGLTSSLRATEAAGTGFRTQFPRTPTLIAYNLSARRTYESPIDKETTNQQIRNTDLHSCPTSDRRY